MKKIIVVIILVFVFIGSGIRAQEKPFVFGFKVAPNIGWMNPSSDDYSSNGSKFGFSWGLLAEFYLMENYSLSSGINILFQNGALNYEDDLVDYGGLGELFRTYKFKYLEVPLTLKMKTNEISGISFFGVFGFGANILLSAKAKDTFLPADGGAAIKDEMDFKSDLKSIRASMIVGVGAEFKMNGVTKLIAGINFDNGLTDVLKNQNIATNVNHKSINNYLEFYVGILF